MNKYDINKKYIYYNKFKVLEAQKLIKIDNKILVLDIISSKR